MIKLNLIRFALGIAIGFMLVGLPGLALAANRIEAEPELDKLQAAPIRPAKIDRPLSQQGPPPQTDRPKSATTQFLTGPNASDPLNIALNYIRQNKQQLGLTDDDLADIVVKDQYRSEHNQVTHIYIRQRLAGIELFNGDININISGAGEVINLGNGFVPDLNNAVNVKAPSISAIDALSAAAGQLGLTLTAPLVPRRSGGGAAQDVLLSDGGISQEDIPARLMYQRHGKEVRLVWQAVIRLKNGQNWWNLRVDAVTGQILDQNDWIAQDGYTVYALPKEHPNDGGRTVETNPATATASPFGWHDTNGAAGPEFTITRGNNVHAYADKDNNNIPDAIAGSEPDGGGALDFNFPIDLTQDPDTYLAASVTNLFYWNNIIHDVLYQYGFNEASGNFQVNNYGNGGSGNDHVQAEAQDGAGVNNANFATPPDGAEPRMQMFLWNITTPRRDGDLDNGIIAHEYGHGISNRLTGGPGNTSCLFNSEQMGEGWSDFIALFLTATPSDTGPAGRGIGTYALGQPPTGPGIRNFHYSTDMAVNPQTYDNIKTTGSSPHALGEIWAVMLWQVYWNLVTDHGFDPNLYSGSGGNNLMMQLVLDGMKLQPCSPGFVDGRDAILLADLNNNGGVNQCRIWEGFAKRGLGYSASQGLSSSRIDGTEAFDLPPQCIQALSITKSANPVQATAGQILTYTLLIRNSTPTTLTGVTVTDTVPADTQYVPASASDGGSESGGVVSWPAVTLPSGQLLTRTFQVTVGNSLVSTHYFTDDMESGSGQWTVSGSGLSAWTLGTINPHSATSAWFANDIGSISDQQLAMTTAPATLGSNVLLKFWHHFNTEANFDGGVVEISANGGAWTDLGTLITQNGYNRTISTFFGNPLGGRQAFSGDSGGYVETRVDLSSYSGDMVQIRFRLGTDNSVADEGWYVDDVEIIKEVSISNTACVVAAEGNSDCDTLITLAEATPLDPPQIEIDPASLNSSQEPDTLVTKTLTISNSGQQNLNWVLSEGTALQSVGARDQVLDVGRNTPQAIPVIGPRAASCSSDISWISAVPISGTTVPGAGTPVAIIFNATSLAPGVYSGTLCVDSNDLVTPRLAVTLALTVEMPTGFKLINFSATSTSTGVVVAWETSREADTSGFNLHRDLIKTGPYSQVNPSLIPATGGTITGATYTYLDTTATDDKVVYYYKLEAVETISSSTFYGPVNTSLPFYLPIIFKEEP